MRITQVQGIEQLNSELQKLAKKAKQETGDVIVGYTQSYAVYVHERTNLRHKAGKSAKYLEIPVRQLANSLLEIIATIYKKTDSLIKGMLIAGLRIQRASQKIVPIDTSALKASAYTAKESNAATAARAALSRSNSIRSGEGKP